MTTKRKRSIGELIREPIMFRGDHYWLVRFFNRVHVVEGRCWKWHGTTSRVGYGLWKWQGHTIGAHRFLFLMIKGDIPVRYTIDHLCRIPLCVNPEHLEAVPMRENARRAGTIDRTHCRRGHAFTPENTYRWQTRRHCRTCVNLRVKRRSSERYSL